MNKKKKILLYTIITVIVISLFCYFNFKDDNQIVYDIAQQGASESKDQFIPEQHTDFIFTTVEAEFNFFYEIIFLISVVIIAVIVRKKLRKKQNIIKD